MDIKSIRNQIPASENNIYLNTGWEGPSPVSVIKAVQERITFENEIGPTTPLVREHNQQLEEGSKSSLAHMINVNVDELLLTQNTTHGLNIVLNGIDWTENDEVLLLSIEYPSVMVLAFHLRERYGVKLNILDVSPTESHDGLLTKMEGALSRKTRLIFSSHIHYMNGLRMPDKALCSLAHKYDTEVLFDGAQGLSHVDLDLHDMGVDYYAMPGQKWLCGPDGIGALFIRNEHIANIKPTFVSSNAAKAWDPNGGYEENSESIEKFRLTTTSSPLKAGFKEAIRFIEEEVGGVKAVEQISGGLASSMKSVLSKIPDLTLHSPSESPEATGLVTFSIEGKSAETIVAELWEKHRIVCRAISPLNGVRLSLHFFNTEHEIEKVEEALRSLS